MNMVDYYYFIYSFVYFQISMTVHQAHVRIVEPALMVSIPSLVFARQGTLVQLATQVRNRLLFLSFFSLSI